MFDNLRWFMSEVSAMSQEWVDETSAKISKQFRLYEPKVKVPVRKVRPTLFDSLKRKGNKTEFLHLINLSLNRNTLDDVVRVVEAGQPIDSVEPESEESRVYLSKILREEIQRQFSHPKRPLIELVLNAIDARAEWDDEPYVVDISVEPNRFEVSDNGKGMSLDRILDTLIIPFSSDKSEIDNIGRFGVGFFSALQYCLDQPRTCKITVTTGDGNLAYELEITSKGKCVEDLQVNLRRISPSTHGTTVRITGLSSTRGNDLGESIDYLREYLDFVDPKKAVLSVNGRAINLKHETSKSAFECRAPVRLIYRGTPVDQEVRVVVDTSPKDKKAMVTYHSQGIFIQGEPIECGSFHIDLPSAILVVEGRDAFKLDENYYATIEAALNAIVGHTKNIQHDPKALGSMREMLAVLLVEQYQHISNATIEKAAEACFPERTFITATSSKEVLTKVGDFFGRGITEQIYAPKSLSEYNFWFHKLPTIHDLVRENTSVIETIELKDIKGGYVGETSDCMREKINNLEERLGRKLHNVELLLNEVPLYFVRLEEPTVTTSPVLNLGDGWYVNVDHPFFSTDGYVTRYGMRTSTLREKHGEKGAEKEMV